MRFTVKNSDLSRELGVLNGIVGRKPTLPVLANVLIRANAGGLLLAATDLEVGLIGACPAEVHEPGATTLPASKLIEIVKAQAGNDTEISLNDKGQVTFKSGKFVSRIQSLPAKDFPGLPTKGGDDAVVLPREAFRAMINQVRYATSETGTNYFLQGALMLLPEDGCSLTSTDTARISRAACERIGEAHPSVIIPNKALDELKGLLATGTDDEFTFSRTERHLFFDSDGRLLISRIIDGKMPDFDKMLARGGGSNRATLNRGEFLATVRRSSLLGDIVTLVLSPGQLQINSVSQMGDASEALAAQYEGPTITIRLRDSFLVDYLSAGTGQDVVLALKDGQSPALLVDGTFVNVMMGMSA